MGYYDECGRIIVRIPIKGTRVVYLPKGHD